MPMTRDEHKQSIQKLLGMVTPDKQAEASELLTTLSDAFEETVTNGETAASRISELTANNETLRAVNAKLFLRVGETDKAVHGQQDNGNQQEQEIPAITYENLFNDKGELI